MIANMSMSAFEAGPSEPSAIRVMPESCSAVTGIRNRRAGNEYAFLGQNRPVVIHERETVRGDGWVIEHAQVVEVLYRGFASFFARVFDLGQRFRNVQVNRQAVGFGFVYDAFEEFWRANVRRVRAETGMNPAIRGVVPLMAKRNLFLCAGADFLVVTDTEYTPRQHRF
jgi:hypothetical protein